jgi:hypothetical protein
LHGSVKVVLTPEAEEFIRERGGKVWVWLDPRRGLVGSYVWLESHAEPPGASRRSRFTRSSRRPHRFSVTTDAGVEVHHAFGRLDPPEELHFDVKGWTRGSKRLEAYWNGSIFVGEDIESPAKRDAYTPPGSRPKKR